MNIKRNIKSLTLFIMAFAFSSCGNEEIIDNEKPIIVDKGIVVCPIDCEVFKKGDIIPFRYTFTDNVELGNYAIEIHNNFDHHTHGTSAADCKEEENKKPIKPWIYNESFTINKKTKEYNATHDIQIPKDIDTGDYHFMIRLTDNAGGTAYKAMAIKIID